MHERLATLTAHSPPGTEARALGPWFHNLHLPDGTETAPTHPLGDFPQVKWRQIAPHIPADLTGLTALDVGCNAGFYSFELARRGASVRALDIDPHYLEQASWAAKRYGLQHRIEFQEGSVYSLARSRERYDIVWFFGVLYHLRHPLLALDILRDVVKGRLYLQTMTCPGSNGVGSMPRNLTLAERGEMNRKGWPRMAFIENALENDPTNWWAPNGACVEGMLRAAGFRVVSNPADEMYVAEPPIAESPFNLRSRHSELQAILGPTWRGQQ
jgi:tRNA (mo5U34)-methyltransferase